MMKPISDYHMHTPLCRHATGEPREYAEHALSIGLKEIGFSDHAPLVSGPAPGVTMTLDELPQYHRMIEDVRKAYADKISIKVAIEADFIPGYEEKTRKLLAGYPYDYVIGSVHFIKNWGFDNPAERDEWNERNITQVYRDYFDLLRQSARSGLFDIMAHVDLVKKFGHRPSDNILEDVRATAKAFKQAGVAVEINTSGLRKDVKEMYPSLDHLAIYAAEGIPLTFGSDAHEPGHVGCDYDKAYALAKQAGYKEYVLYKKRKIHQVIPL